MLPSPGGGGGGGCDEPKKPGLNTVNSSEQFIFYRTNVDAFFISAPNTSDTAVAVLAWLSWV